MYFHKTRPFIKKLYPTLEWSIGGNSEPVIYLTFDDGPIPDVTHFVLDTLAHFKAKASFFCVGDNIKKHSSIFKEIVKKGHSVGNHTFNHLNGWVTKEKTYINNIKMCQQVMNENLKGLDYKEKDKRRLFRPPYGKMSPSQHSYLASRYRIIMWDVLTGDFDRKLSAEDCLDKAIACTEAGSIVTFHDSLKAAPTLQYVLPRFMKYFANQGYSFEAL